MYYDGTKLLSLKDIDGITPELFLCSSNRSAGKTTYFNRLLVNRFLKKQAQFCLLYRFNYELDDVANKFFSEIKNLFFNDYEMSSVSCSKGIYHKLFIKHKSEKEPKLIGFAIALNNADQLRKYSHYFSKVDSILFDEFQSESGHYCDKEMIKFQSIHTTIARGGGKQCRYVPVYLLSNSVSILNPYYAALGISDRLNDKTNFLRGKGFVLEQGFNESASKAQINSRFNIAFSQVDNSYIQYASQNVYLNDSKAFIEKPHGKSRYIVTLKYNNKEYAIREYLDSGLLYCDNDVDTTFKYKLALTTNDHDINYLMLKRNELFISNMRFFFDKGCFRFKNLDCKAVIIKALAYK